MVRARPYPNALYQNRLIEDRWGNLAIGLNNITSSSKPNGYRVIPDSLPLLLDANISETRIGNTCISTISCRCLISGSILGSLRKCSILSVKTSNIAILTSQLPRFSWDTAFHCIPLAMVDPAFAKKQLDLMTREWYMKPDGALPAYEWNFSDVNPPVHAW